MVFDLELILRIHGSECRQDFMEPELCVIHVVECCVLRRRNHLFYTKDWWFDKLQTMGSSDPLRWKSQGFSMLHLHCSASMIPGEQWLVPSWLTVEYHRRPWYTQTAHGKKNGKIKPTVRSRMEYAKRIFSINTTSQICKTLAPTWPSKKLLDGSSPKSCRFLRLSNNFEHL